MVGYMTSLAEQPASCFSVASTVNLQTISTNHLKNKRVIVRVDFNVPIENGVIQDNSRIKNAFPTIKLLREAGAKIILISHLGKTTAPCAEQSLRILIDEVAREYGSNVAFIDDCLAENAASIINNSNAGDIILMENLRFHPEEEKCDMKFAKRLASLADLYVNEAFSVSHRKHASIWGIPQFLVSAFGISFKREVRTIDDFYNKAPSPKICIIGGAKLSTKIKLLKNLVKKVDKLIIGGKIVEAFLAFQGNSSFKLVDLGEFKEDVAEIIANARQRGCELIMPIDFSAMICENGVFHHAIVSSESDVATIFDIGPASIELFKRHIEKSKIVLWNGPVGLFEKAPFDRGTAAIAQLVAKLTRERKLLSIIGGGDTGFAMNKFNAAQDMTYVSTAGGAFLSYLEGSELPGIAAIPDPKKTPGR
ncbi:MAG: phosphoglycerate kinase [Holosporaceae bacterium]|jgi:phosphoglycerate kinase|nr:phosphoglycerate kinase [Holosporaceae bacterium]